MKNKKRMKELDARVGKLEKQIAKTMLDEGVGIFEAAAKADEPVCISITEMIVENADNAEEDLIYGILDRNGRPFGPLNEPFHDAETVRRAYSSWRMTK